MKDYILLVEDNPDDADLTILAFKSSAIANEVVVALVLGIGGRPLHRIGPAK